MARKTFYDGFRVRVQEINEYLAKHGPAMIINLNIVGAADANGVLYTTTLTTLQNALTEIATAWPTYSEPQ